VPPVIEELLPVPDAAWCCAQLAGVPYRLFLDSAASGTSSGWRLGRYSFLMADPVAVVRSRGRSTTVQAPDGPGTDFVETVDTDALATVRRLLEPFRCEAVDGLPPFQGGAAGYLGYDWGLTLERLPAPRLDDLGLDDVVIGLYDWVLAWDHLAGRAWLISTGMAIVNPGGARARARASQVKDWLASGSSRPPEPDGGHTETPREMAPSYPVAGEGWDQALDLRSSFPRSGYLDAVSRVREYIYAGDIFQANLSQRFETPFPDNPWTFYERLRARNPAPFSAFFECPGAAVLSTSPERFLRVTAEGHVETRPIKGTRARGVGPEHDAALGQALTESVKDRAENLMIVDLMRNDLSRVCASGSVRVSELFALERYATVHHLVSTVVGTLEPDRDAFDLLRAAFPGGSITGAPKLRAMEIIAELEPSRRGVYCGSIGYWSVTGDVDTSIAIRTAVVRGGRIYFSAGGGIVADSDPEQEYRETLDKVRATIDTLASS
jgi:para-aminobenzoate synthetase component 1